jgi:hypothetical protein
MGGLVQHSDSGLGGVDIAMYGVDLDRLIVTVFRAFIA